MRALLLIVILTCVACSALFAETKEPVYLGIDAKGGRHESKESAGNAPWMRDLAHARMPAPLPGERWEWYQGVGIFRIRIDPASGSAREVTILRSTGHVMFDRGAVRALKVWQWKPGTWTQVDVPLYFQEGGGVLIFPRYTTLRVRP
ncbi:MAG TPA: TonB family protein [Chthoniobacterales bacterium]|nr:TonB family protein [Chthoniobacterales bacterium]